MESNDFSKLDFLQGLKFMQVRLEGKVVFIQLTAKKMVALSTPLTQELVNVCEKVDKMDNVGAIVLTGQKNAFAAGADIKEMANKKFPGVYLENMTHADRLAFVKTPIIAAVEGFCLGGGCELAMICDIVYAGESAMFGQPEIKLGIIPGMGGTQRLVRAIGKSKAMEMVLTGKMFTAQEAEKWGLISKVVPNDKVIETAMKTAKTIANYSKHVVQMCKECVNNSYNMVLDQGLLYEKRMFQSCFATEDQKEGMKAFVEKRKPNFKNK